ncbi:uncharacterized protein LOC129747271 [Uranotaenia lowii]|uniref:uncharacterized protein LOC129747271 n=1 Tax=Uranotaenia lowii TaxID=190385 RepID=UPI00247A6818|nr:uncharacterized protein LOC129747271 [Uranotaenia lowii]
MKQPTDRVGKCSGMLFLLAVQIALSNAAATDLNISLTFDEHSNGTKLYRRSKRDVDVNYLYGRTSTESLLQQIRNQPYISQLIDGFVKTFEKMNQNGELSSSAVIKLAIFVKETLNMPNFYNVNPTDQARLRSLKNVLPLSAKNAVFARRVCIKNVQHDEYLYSPHPYYYDVQRRRVFTWVPGDRPIPQGMWELEFNGRHVFIRNDENREQLYAPANIYKYDNDRRRVFTWNPSSDRIGDAGAWKFEPEGDYMYIKSVSYGEYLYAAGDGFKHDVDRRTVFTWKKDERISNGIWSIEDCS